MEESFTFTEPLLYILRHDKDYSFKSTVHCFISTFPKNVFFPPRINVLFFFFFFFFNESSRLSDSRFLYVLCSAMYGSFTGIWCSPDLAPPPAWALFAGVRVALCLLQALVWVFKAIWQKQKRESHCFGYGHTTVFLQLDWGLVWYDNSGAKHTALILFLQEVTENPVENQEGAESIRGKKRKYGFTSAISTFLSQVWILCRSFLCLSLTFMYSVISGAW